MKKTCVNCCHYHGYLGEDSGYHIHDYCSSWNCCINSDMESPINAFLDSYWDDIVWDDDVGVSTDLETGEAYCWRYSENPQENDFLSDKEMDKNRIRNRQLAIRTLDKLLKTGKCHACNGEIIDIPQEDLVYINELKQKIMSEILKEN